MASVRRRPQGKRHVSACRGWAGEGERAICCAAIPPSPPRALARTCQLESYAATLDTSRISTQEYQAVRTFLLRAASLPPGPRSALALQLANPLAGRLRPPPPAGISPELYLCCVAAAYQQRQRLATAPGAAGAVGPGP